MTFSLFDHDHSCVYLQDQYAELESQHQFGGSLNDTGYRVTNLDRPVQLVFLLDTDDPMVPVSLPGIRYVPLVHGFQYCSNGEEFVYRLLNESEIEVISAVDDDFDEYFPYVEYPECFPSRGMQFRRLEHNPEKAEDALRYQGLFGIDELPEKEIERAVGIARSTWHPEMFSLDYTKDLSGEQVIRQYGCAPFMQDCPSDSCTNPKCTAGVQEYVEAEDIELSPEAAELLGEPTMRIDAYVIRVPSLRVIGILEDDVHDELLWGMGGVQLIFQLCNECGCITVSNQCT